MSAHVAEETVLDGVDFELTCWTATPDDHEATLSIQCRACKSGVFSCEGHYLKLRASLGGRGKVVCRVCGHSARTFDDVAEVIPL